MEQLLKDLSRFTDSLSADENIDGYILVKVSNSKDSIIAVGGSIPGVLACFCILRDSIEEHLREAGGFTDEEIKQLLEV